MDSFCDKTSKQFGVDDGNDITMTMMMLMTMSMIMTMTMKHLYSSLVGRDEPVVSLGTNSEFTEYMAAMRGQILQSPHYVALIFQTCQLHTAWESAWEWLQWAASNLAWETALAGQTTPRKIPNKKIYWYRNTVFPSICPSSSPWGVKSGQGPTRASIWSYCQTSSKPILPLCPRRCQTSQRILPSPRLLPGCFSPSSLPGCPSPKARPPLLPAAGRPLLRTVAN